MNKRKIKRFIIYLVGVLTKTAQLIYNKFKTITRLSIVVHLAKIIKYFIKKILNLFTPLILSLYRILLKFPPTKFVINKFIRPVILKIKNKFEKIDSKYQITNTRVWSRQRKVGFGLSLVILTALLTFTAIKLWGPKPVAAWWDETWGFRKKVELNNSSGSPLSNYTAGFVLGTINSSNINSDCSDIRITNGAGTMISDNYWVDCTESVNPTVWVKFSTVPTGISRYYIYYGNSSASNLASTIEQVFDFGYDYAGTTINETKIDYGGGIITQNDYLTIVNDGDGWDTRIYTDSTFTRSANLTLQMKLKADTGARIMVGWHDGGTGVGYGDLIYALYFNSGTFNIFEDGTQRSCPSCTTYTVGTWYDVKIVLKATGATYYYKATGATSWTQIYDSSYSSETPLKIGVAHYDAIEKSYTDNWFTRTELASEPAITVSAEEAAGRPIAYWKFDEGYTENLNQPLTNQEQQINIINQTYSQKGDDWFPNDNTLGIVHWDADKYSGATVYFEAVIKTSYINDPAYVRLATTGGSAISTLNTTTGSWQRLRSGALTLTDDADYTVQIRNNHYSRTSYIKSARLIIVQEDATKITSTETQIELGDNEATTSGGYTSLTDPKYYYYDSTKFSPAPTAYFEAAYEPYSPKIEQQINITNQFYSQKGDDWFPNDNTLGIVHWDADKYSGATVYFEVVMRTSYYADLAYARLTTTGGSVVSTLNTNNYYGAYGAGDSWQKLRSDALSLTDDTDYTVQIRNAHYSRTTYLKSARLIIIQENGSKITSTETQIELGDNEATTSGGYTSLTDPKYYYYDSTKFSPTPTTYFEAAFEPYSPKIEQQINITNLPYSQLGDNWFPTDNSLGIIHWDADKYSGATVYFEVVIKSNSANDLAYARLTSTGGSVVSTLNTINYNGPYGDSATWQRLRSGALTLTDDTDYTIQIKNAHYTRITYIKSARIIIVQEDATKLTNTETQIELGNTVPSSATSYTTLTDPKYYYYDSTKFSPSPTAYFEATFEPYSPKIEQQINITDRYFSQLGTTYAPTDNSLGIIHWDADKYSGATVYFEAVMASSSGSDQAYARLIETDGTVVSTVNTFNYNNPYGNNAAWQRIRSGALNLTDETEYTVQISNGYSTRTTNLKSARLIIIQEDSTKIIDTETQIELGNYQAGFTNTSATKLTDEKIYLYDQGRFSPTPESSGDISFSATLKTNSSGDTAYAELYNKTNNQVVATISHTGNTDWTYASVANIDADSDWDTTNDDEYYVRVYCADGDTGGCSGNIANAKIHLTQTDASGITDLEVVQSMAVTAVTDADTTYTSQGYLSHLNKPAFGTVPTVYHETTIKTTAGTGYAQLTAYVDGTVANSEITTTSNGYERVRGGTNLYNRIAFTVDYRDVDLQIKNSATNTTTVSNSWLVIQVSDLPTSGITGNVELYNKTDTTSVSGSELTFTSIDYALVRSNSITLTTGKEYEVRIKQGKLLGAKLILDQSDAGGITDLEVVQTMANTAVTDADATYTSQGYLSNFTKTAFGTVPAVYHEATMKTTAGTGYAQLTAYVDGAVTDSEVSTNNAAYERARSSSNIYSRLPFNSGDQDVDLQIKNSATNTTTVSNSWLVIQISGLPTSGVVGNVELYNKTDTTSISGSELTFTSIDYAVVRSNAITLTTGKEYEVRIKQGKLLGAKLILDQSDAGGITDLEVVQTMANTAVTDADATYTSQGYLSNFTKTAFGTVPVVYHEATMKTTAGTGYAQLTAYVDGDVVNSEINTVNSGYERVRGNSDLYTQLPFNSDDHDVDLQIKNSATNTTTVSNSWLVIQVSDLPTSGITGNVELYNKTDTTSVSGSELTFTSIDYALVRSNSITLTTGKEYEVRIKQGKLLGAKLILDQSDAQGLTSVETVIQTVNTKSTDSDSTYTDQEFFNYFNPSNYHFVFDYTTSYSYFESTMKTSAGTGYAQFKNTTDGTTISGSEILTTNSSYERVRSAAITANMPSSAKEMDTLVKNSATNTTTVSNSWLVIQNSNSVPSITHDSSSSALHGSIADVATWNTGSECISGNCLKYDGADDYVSVGDNSKLDFSAADDFSISLWFKRAQITSGTEVLMAKHYSTSESDGGYKIYMESDGDITAGIDDDNSGFPEDFATSTSATYDDNVWHHIAMVKDGTSTLKLYIDGNLIDTDSDIAANGTLANTDTLFIGIDGDGSSNAFEGNIDEVKVYPYAKNSEQIKLDFVRGTAVLGESNNPRLAEDLVGYFKMDETSADSCDGTNDSCDSSGYGNHAAWNDNAGSSTGKFGNALNLDGTNDRSVISTNKGIPSTWNYRTKITFDNSASTEDLSNFPVMVKLNSSRIDYSKTQDAGQDIRFTDTDGTTQLPHEIEKWDEAGDSYVWVKVPIIAAGSTTDYIYLYYGNSVASDNQNPEGVWNSDYSLVQHLDETTGVLNEDSTSNNRDSTKLTPTDPNPTITGQVDGSQDFAGDNDYTIRAYNGTSLDELSVSYWANPDQTQSVQKGLFQWANGLTSGAPFMLVAREANTTDLKFYVDQAYRFDYAINNLSYSYITVTLNSSNLWKFFVDGISRGSYQDDANHALQASAINVYLGNGYNGYFDGKIDEFRISEIARSEEWIEAEYKTMTDTFNTYGVEEASSAIATRTPFSVSAWVNGSTLGAASRAIIARGNSEDYSWAIYNDSANPGKLAFTADGADNTGVSNSTLSTNTWYHITMTSDGAKTRLYINGSLDKETNNSGVLPGGSVSIGADPDGTNAWAGKIDEVRIYKRALDLYEVAQLYKWSPGVIAHWKMDEGTGQYAYDTSVNSNNGTLGSSNDTDTNDPSWVVGKYGNGLKFDGNDNYIDAGFASTLRFTSQPFVISAWVNPAVSHFGEIIASDDGTHGYALLLTNTNTVRFVTRGITDEYTDTTATVPNNTWTHITAVYTGTNGSRIIYINGIESSRENFTGTMALADDPVYIGKNASESNLFDGIIDDLKIYNYTINQEEVIEDMNAGHPLPGSPVGSPILHLKFDEGWGDTANDSSPQNNDANLGGTGAACPGPSTCPNTSALGIKHQSMLFNGTNNTMADVPSSTDLDAPQQTWSLWIYTDGNWDTADGGEYDVAAIMARADATGSNNGTVVTMGRSGTSGPYQSRVSLHVKDGSDYVSLLTSTSQLADSKWHHIAFTFDQSSGSVNNLYVDGTLEDTDPNDRSWTFNNQNIRFGDALGTWWEEYSGRLDEVKIYNSILTPDQVAMEYNLGKAMLLGASSTSSDGSTPSSEYNRQLCVPGDTTNCSAAIGEWLFDANAGTYTVDTSTGETHGRLGGDGVGTDLPKWITGKVGNALEFDGDDDYISLANSTALSPGANNLSISAWIKPRVLNSQDQRIYNDYGSVTNNLVLLRINTSNKIQAFFRDASGDLASPESTTTPTADTWYHVVAVREGSTVRIYVNGMLENSATNAAMTTITTSDGTVPMIGVYPLDATSFNFDGIIDEVRVYSYARSAAQVAWEYNRGVPLAHWKFDECTGDTAHDSAPKADRNSTRYNGTIYPQSLDNTSTGTCNSGQVTQMWNDGTTGKYNGSLGFDGTDDYATHTYQLSKDEGSISHWLQPDQLRSMVAYYESDGTTVNYDGFGLGVAGLEIHTGINSSNWIFYYQDADSDDRVSMAGGGTPSTTEWTHVVATWKRTGNAYLYVNGQQVASAVMSTHTFSSRTATVKQLGRNGVGTTDRHWAGKMDDVKIYNYALNANQIKTLFNQGAVRFGQ